ncbi:hypothetical protein GCM10009630_10050 [Kribbella jejuensis]|uniref:CocE/NonD family hydrolase n=1 Tax=Kribbella jejuensis TaxID=236068 RepID=UPI001152B18E|nr:CocE/NonD family hydrolase [Kribbella jejuensis]
MAIPEHAYQQGPLDLFNMLSWSDLLSHQEDVGSVAGLVRMMRAERRLRGALERLPLRGTMDGLGGRGAPWYDEWIDHPDVHDPYWDGFRATEALARSTVPTLLIGGWYDYQIDLVGCGEVAGVIGLCAVLELEAQGGPGGGLGGAGGGDGADLPVVVAEPGVGQVLGGFVVLGGLQGPGGDLSPGSDGQWCPRHVLPPTGVSVTCSTLGRLRRVGESDMSRTPVS